MEPAPLTENQPLKAKKQPGINKEQMNSAKVQPTQRRESFIEVRENPEDKKSPPVKIKVKTRGQAAAKLIVSSTRTSSTPPTHAETKERLTLPACIIKTFKKIFDTSTDRTGIPWSAFVTAMANLGFSTVPIGGSAFRFSSQKWGCMSIHRPHPGDRVEGFAALKLRGRLTRRFGWELDTFVADKAEPKVSGQKSSGKGKGKGKGIKGKK